MNSPKMGNFSNMIKKTYVGFVDSKDWPHFSWSIQIGTELFNYKTGIGHATPRWDARTLKPNKKPAGKEVLLENDRWLHIPSNDDILESLFSDAEAGMVSFNEFCMNYGYSNDSLKALDTYRACMGTTERLRRALGPSFESERKRIHERIA
jgi:hypothetical protein